MYPQFDVNPERSLANVDTIPQSKTTTPRVEEGANGCKGIDALPLWFSCLQSSDSLLRPSELKAEDVNELASKDCVETKSAPHLYNESGTQVAKNAAFHNDFPHQTVSIQYVSIRIGASKWN